MYFLVDMCCLCLNISNDITLISLADFDNDHVSFYDKLTTSLSNLVTGVNFNEYKVCTKCCFTVRQVYKCNNMFTRNMTMYMNYKTILNTPENNQAQLVVISSENIYDIKSELTDIIENEGSSCLVDVIESLEFPKIKDEIIDELSQYKGQLDNPSSFSGTVIETEELDIKPDSPPDSSYEEECVDDFYRNDSKNQNITTPNSNEDEDVQSVTQSEENMKEIHLHECEDLPNKTNALLEDEYVDDVHNDSKYRQTTIPNSDVTNLEEQITIGENMITSTNKNKRKINKKILNQKYNFASRKHVRTGDKTYVCNICIKGFKHMSDLSRHAVFHTGEKKYVCNVCKKKFYQQGDLNRHERGHTGERKYGCNICNKGFKRKSHLTTHAVLHTGEKKYVCKMCKKKFYQQGELTRHKLVHTDDRNYVCNICNKDFKQKCSLTRHALVHSGEKKYICNVCKKRFYEQGALKRHNLVHTGERKYVCNVCKKRFNQKGNLTTHELVHTGERQHVCNICNKGFKQKFHLIRHVVVHTGPKECVYKVCNIEYKKCKSNLS